MKRKAEEDSMIKLMAFDLDNTLAKLGKGIIEMDLHLLREIEKQGVRIAICSGKPVSYLCGFMRQAGLESPVLVGENGAVIQVGVGLPPEIYDILPYSEEAKRTIHWMREKITELLPHIWYQQNEVGLTPFPVNDDEFQIIEGCIQKYKGKMKDVIVYRHVDSFDIVPIGIDKKYGLKYLGRLLQIAPEEIAAVGDGVNDYPMFEYAGYSVGINVKERSRVDVNFLTSTDALRHLYTLAKSRD